MPFQRAMFLGMVPSLFMLISTYIGLGREVQEDISGALQHFAAGVLLCTVCTELVPEIVNAEGLAENTAAFVGFFGGVAVLIILGMFAPEEFDDSERNNQPDKNGGDGHANGGSIRDENIFPGLNGSASPTPGQRQQMREMRFVIAGRKFRQRPTLRSKAGRLVVKRSMSLSSLPMVTENQPLLPPSKNSNRSSNNAYTEENAEESKPDNNILDLPQSHDIEAKQFPLAFVLAVAIDSSLDGLLIGIASAAGPSAGPMMSASLSVEMGFLGLTLATTLYGQPLHKAASAALVGPACLVFAAGVGGIMADTLSHSPTAFIGMLSFGSSALLFMVAEELLLDAHESGEHVWWVDLQLYTGFFVSIMAGKFVR